MTLETLSSNEFPAFLVYDTISATPLNHPTDPSSTQSFFLDNNAGCSGAAGGSDGLAPSKLNNSVPDSKPGSSTAAAGQGRRKRRRRQRSCKNKEEAESQRMTHIAVERNRRRLMNEHLSVLRSLMPDSYIQRGDQASIVGGAIDFVKELEQHLQSLEVQKRTLQQQKRANNSIDQSTDNGCSSNQDECELPPFAQFFAYPQYTRHHAPREFSHMAPENQSALADIEVTLIETHANLRILSPRRPRQLLKMVAGLQSLRFSILHVNVTTLDSMVLYSLSAKVEDGCNLTTVDDIATAVHHLLSLIEAEATALSQ